MQDRDLDELQRIWDLKERGAISNDEYLELKNRILSQIAEPQSGTQGSERQPPSATSVPKQSIHGTGRQHAVVVGCLVVFGLVLILALIGSNSSTGNSVANEAAAPTKPPLSPEQRQRQIEAALTALKTTGSKDYKRKNELYLSLEALDPQNPKYQQMAIKYANLIDTEKRPAPEPNTETAYAAASAAIPSFDTEAYCRKIGDTAGGSYEIEETCRDEEAKALSQLNSQSIRARTLEYCSRIGDTAGAHT
jgi:hypothetical protein